MLASAPRPRVLLLTPWFPNSPGDREGNFVYGSAASLVRAGASVGVLVVRPLLTFAVSRWGHHATSPRFDRAAFPEFEFMRLVRYAGIPRNVLPAADAWLHDRAVSAALEAAVAEFRPSVIHAHTEGEGPVAVAAARKFNLPVVVTLHGINTAPRYFASDYRRARFRDALVAADRVVVVGQPLVPFFAEFAGDGVSFDAIPNGFEPPADLPRVRTDTGGPLRFISVSNLHEGKGIDIALQALAKARDLGLEDFSYTIVGEGEQREALTALVADLRLQDRVRFAGACAHSKVYELLREADIFLLPSYREAFGVAYLEAMAAGLLAVGVEGQGPAAFIRDGETGCLVPPHDAEALAGRLISLAQDRACLRAMAAAGRAYVTENLTWDSHAQRLLQLYDDVLHQSGAAPSRPAPLSERHTS